MRAPAVVQQAVREYAVPNDYTIYGKTKLASSFIYEHGVRLKRESDNKIFWVCLASQQCRDEFTAFRMCQGKTSKAALHLRVKHGIVSPKTTVTAATAAGREARLNKLKQSRLFKDNPARFTVLLETLRVVLNNLRTEPSKFRATLNTKIINKTIYELYLSSKREIVAVINAARMNCANFTLVADFWTSKVQGTKYLGVRMYFVDAAFKFQSILLGTRAFNPQYGDRDLGIKGPFRQWLNDIISGFGMKSTDFYGSTTDGGGDVKRMMSEELALTWAWCIPHMSNAATKSAFGLVDDVKKSKNPPMTKLLKAIVKTVYQTKHVEVMGTLFEELCKMLSSDNSTKLLDYRSHRFLGLTRVIERILEKWSALREWYRARHDKAIREGSKKVPVFLLKHHRTDLEQLLSLLKPISLLNTMAQAEDANQVDVLLALYTLRMTTFDPFEPLRDYRSLPPPAQPRYFLVEDLTPLVADTRKLLCDAFFTRFFKRYVRTKAMEKCSFVFEMQMALHPDFKDFESSLLPLVQLLHAQHRTPQRSDEEQKEEQQEDHDELAMFNYLSVTAVIKNKISNEMMKCLPRVDAPPSVTVVQNENRRRFGSNRHQASIQQIENENRLAVREELLRWFNDPTALLADNEGTLESVLNYWERQQLIGRYRLLPLVARIIFAVPASSAQLERDFGVSGMHVTPTRASVGFENVDMCAFLNRNRAFIDITQCSPVSSDVEMENRHYNIMEEVDSNFNGPPMFSNE